MEIIRHEDTARDMKKLGRFQAPLESLEAWERLFLLKGLKETPAIDLFPGFGGHRIYKGRVVPLKENFGKSKGYRVVFEIIKQGEVLACKILVFSRHGVYRSEKDLVVLVKERIE